MIDIPGLSGYRSIFESESQAARVITNGLRYILLIQNSEANVTIRIPLKGTRVPIGGIFLGEFLLAWQRQLLMHIKTCLELGAGEYAPASFYMVAFQQDLESEATEIRTDAVSYLEDTINVNALSKRMRVYEGALFEPIKPGATYNLVISNIAQLPEPRGLTKSLYDHGGRDGWKVLTQIISESQAFMNSSGYLAVTAFEFLGIEERTAAEIPCMQERMASNGLRIASKAILKRQVRPIGQFHRSLPYILQMYPNAQFLNENGFRVDPIETLQAGQSVFHNCVAVLAVRS